MGPIIHFLFRKHRKYANTTPRPKVIEEKKILYEQQEGCCFFCGEKLGWKYFTVDHIIPRRRGGEDVLENLVGSCSSCNKLRDIIESDLAVGRPLEPYLLAEIPRLLPIVKEKHVRELMCGVEVEK